MRNVVQFYDEKDAVTGKRKHSFSNAQQHFKRVKDRSYIYRFRRYVEGKGTAKQKFNQIDSFVYESFMQARSQLLSVHNIDLKRWAMKRALELSDHAFTVSNYWIYRFKQRHSIVSRKITKLVTKREFEDKDMIKKTTDDFVNSVKKLF
jgi:hypothetical protein